MTQHEAFYGLPIQKVFSFLRTHPGVLFILEEICLQTGCTPTQAQKALDALARDGVIDQEQTVGGRGGYVYRQG